MIDSVYFSDDVLKKATHYHDCHQILFIKKGRIAVTINDSNHIASSGDLLILGRFDNHAISVLSDEYERYILRLRPSEIKNNRESSFLTIRPQNFKNLLNTGNYFDIFVSIFELILKEMKSSDIFSEQMKESLVSELFVYICRLESILDADLENRYISTVREIQNEFDKNCKKQYTLKSLAEKYHISESTLSHNFKAIVGVSVFEYLMSSRVATAKNLLAKTNKDISEIVEECGFTDCANFSRTFKKRLYMTPSEFRKKHLNE